MRYREIDPLTRVAGILWASLSLIAVGIGAWAIWNGTHGSDEPDRSRVLSHDGAKQIWIGLVFVVMGGLSAAFGLALTFERDARKMLSKRWISNRRTGVVPDGKTTIFFLAFLAGGLVLLSGMLVPGAFSQSPAAIVVTLCFLAAGTAGLWAIFTKTRKQRERSSRAATMVADAREKRRAAKRKRS